MIDHFKEITIFGEKLEVITEFVNYIFSLGNTEVDASNIVIYENNGGYWNKSKEKKPRKLESVVF
jgi:SpoVK/Ycf46/Vps4 family AAA+-type ATPase